MSGVAPTRRRHVVRNDPNRATIYLAWWLVLAIFFEYARPGSYLTGLNALRLNSLIPLGLVAVCLFAGNLRSYAEIMSDPITKWVLVYFGLVVLSLAHADVTFYPYMVMTATLGYVFFTFVITRICTTVNRIHGVFAILVVAHMFLLAMNPQVVLNPQQRHYIMGATFLGDGNDFSLSVCILIPMVIELALASKQRLVKLLCWGAVIVLILTIVGTQSRGGTLGLAALGVYLWWRSPRKGVTLVLVLLVVAAVFAYAPQQYFGRMSSITNYEQDGSAMGRITAWKAARQMCRDNPLLGVGAGMFPVSFGTRYRPEEHMPWLTAHSMYFLVLGELAVPGIVTLLVLVVGNIRASRRVLDRLAAKRAPVKIRASRRVLDQLAAKGAPVKIRASRRVLDRLAAKGAPVKAMHSREDPARLLQLLNASMVGFAVAGAFLSVSYYPHIFVLSGLMISARRIALAGLEPVPPSRPPARARPAPHGRSNPVAPSILR